MPKKTKKKKLEARRHRLQKKQELSNSYSVSVQEKPEQSSPVQTVTHEPKPKKSIFEDHKQSTVYFRNDLLKSLMITMIIICVQVAVYVAQISGTIDITNLITF